MGDYRFFQLLQLTDPTLPIGGFSHSAGLETYVQRGIVYDLPSSYSFLQAMLVHNIQYTDAALVSLSYDHTQNGDMEMLCRLDELCTAIKLPREIRQASNKLGIRLLKIFQPMLDHPIVTNYRLAIDDRRIMGHYCILFGMMAAVMKIAKKEALAGFYYNAATSMVTNCVKLIPLGQQDGQQLLFSLHPQLEELAERSMTPDPDMVGICCTGFDIRCMQHEALYSRLYMS